MQAASASRSPAPLLPGLLLLSLLLLSLPPPAVAQVHRCEQAGRISFSDQPCEAGATATRKDYAPATAGGALDMQIETTHYPVYGRDYDALTESLRARGPQGFHGFAKWRVSYAYRTRQQGGSCRIESVITRVNGEVLMPRWIDESSAPRNLQRNWIDYYAALKRHEDGHIQHGREFALLLKERLLGINTAACDQIEALADAMFQRLYDALKTRDQAYDRRTQHGATQGAYFQRNP